MGVLKAGKKFLLIFAGGGGIGFILLMLVYMLPTEPMIKNAGASLDIFKIEGAYAQSVHGYPSTTLDNYTDAWMLRNALYNGEESVLQKALHVYFYSYTDGETTDSAQRLVNWLEGRDGYERADYARYWHGYLTVLKPLLCLFDYADIREILKFTGLALLICVCVLLEKMHMPRYIPAFAAAMACMEFHTVGMSMQYTWVFIISMSFSIYILKRNGDMTKKQETGLLFLVIGMATSYFDFLTYPVFTLGIPLLFWTVCMREAGKEEGLLRKALKNSVCWAAGYAGMWAEKWILYTILTGENLFADAVHSVMIRSGRNVSGESIGYWDAVYKNIGVIVKYPYVLAFLAAAVLLFCLGGKECRVRFSGAAFVTYLSIAALPFGWYVISANHSYIHSFMTYKSLGVTVFAVLCAAGEAWNLIRTYFLNRVRRHPVCVIIGIWEERKRRNKTE